MSLSAVQRIMKVMKSMKCYDRSILNSMTVIDVGQGSIKCQMPVEDHHLNQQGTLHGGCTATIVDAVSSLAFMTVDGKPGVSIELNVSYMKAAKPGETITITSDVLKGKGGVRFANCDLFNEVGDRVASGRHVKAMR